MLRVVEALESARVCPCDCFHVLSREERVAGVRAVYDLDDALRGWGYTPIYDVHGDLLFRRAQRDAPAGYRGVAVRFGECIYKRLVGSMLHEVIHALSGDVTLPNHGIPFGLPYGVPESVPPEEEEAYLAPFNDGEARAWAGVWILGKHRYGIAWDLRTARDIGTYGFPGGNALVSVPKGFRAVAHIDRQHHAERYYAKGRKLEADARAFVEAHKDELSRRIDEARDRGRASRPRAYPDAERIAALEPKKIGRNDPCVCGSDKKFKQCCAVRGTLAHYHPALAR